MTDFVITGGRSSTYPITHYGAHVVGNRYTVCLPEDFEALSANVLAIPNFPVSVLSASPVGVANTFFGMHIADRFNDDIKGLEFKTVRSHDMRSGTSQWRALEPNAPVGGVHTYNWTNLDAWVAKHSAAGRDLVFTLFGSPRWSVAAAKQNEIGIFGPSYPGLQAEPEDMANWSAFCAAVATRYPEIGYYEVWNEPNMNNNGTSVTHATNFFFSGTFAKLAEMVRLANQAIKAVRPTAKIICPAVQGWATTSGASDSYFTGMMDAATGDGSTKMKDWVDIIGVHLYLPTTNRVQDLAGLINRVNASKTAAGVSALETWDTESAPIGGDAITLSDERLKALMARMLIIMAAKGIARTIYYQLDHGTMGFYNRPDVSAYRAEIIALLKSGYIRAVSGFNDGRVAYYTHRLNII